MRLAVTVLGVFSTLSSMLAVFAWKKRAEALRLGSVALRLGSENASWQAEQQAREARRLFGMNYLEQGRGLLVDGHPTQALPYLVAARDHAIESPVLRMLFAQATTSLPFVTFVGHRSFVMRASFSPDGTRVVTASLDNTARVWDAQTGKPMTGPLEHQGYVS